MRNQTKHTKVLPPIGERLDAAEHELARLKALLDRFDAVLHDILAVTPADSEPAKKINELFGELEREASA